MREILVISGKGGTGKTSLTAAFAHLSSNAIICDLDVDAPDLHLLLQPKKIHTHAFHSGAEARIQPELCEHCGLCMEMCRYGAIHHGSDIQGTDSPLIDPLKCEGCKVCVHFCPAQAIAFEEKHCGNWFESQTRFGPMIHAQLFPAEENSGRLVALLRQKAKQQAEAEGYSILLDDGAPGIGCPVISSLSGVHLAVLVTETTPSGKHDLARIAELCDHFDIPVAVIINKCDLNEKIAMEIRAECQRSGHTLLAEIPFDPVFVHAMVQGRTVTEFSNHPLVKDIAWAWEKIMMLAGVGQNVEVN